MSPPRTIIGKIWDAHVVSQQKGHPAIFAIDLQLIHEVTSAQAFDVLRREKLPVLEPHHCLATFDHAIPTIGDRDNIRDQMAHRQVETLKRNAREFGVPLYDFASKKQGIVHVIGPEQGLTQPGMTIVCGDSHTATHGAFGALAFGIGTTEVGLVLATGCLLQSEPKTMRVIFDGTMKPGVYAKDLILALIAKIGIGGANGHVIEYCGSAIERMTMEERMTICNMSIECGARAGLVAPDQTTIEYIKGKPFAPTDRRFEEAAKLWLSLTSDTGAEFDRELKINVDQLEPMITWGTNPGQGMPITGTIPRIKDLPESERNNATKALEYVKLKEGQPILGVPIDWAFLGSCTNGRLSDLRIAASMLKGKKIAKSVRMLVVPGSECVKVAAQEEGLDKIFMKAGAEWRNPGCSACLGMNDDKVPSGARCISSSNRNFVGRQGPGSITHLASPATVAASAIAGKIALPISFIKPVTKNQ
ncbi:MAG: 3-isopropylmalate dehydratase large subunit [Candidatus Peribacteraceae bacterium]|nr:3-isopropylmalate dehydratase large subunit [Candidatus Peribacteraceae bacterium]